MSVAPVEWRTRRLPGPAGSHSAAAPAVPDRKDRTTAMTSTTPSRLAHMIELARATVPPMHPAGRPLVAAIAGGALAVRALLGAVGLPRTGAVAGRLGLACSAGTALFFRVPRRVPPTDRSAVVAPADGLISQIVAATPPAETGLGATARTRVSIFLSLLDVHVQWAPVDGVVRSVHYHPGAFFSADLDKASEANERNSLVINPSAGGDEVVVTQIAGLLARRIVCDVTVGSPVRTGEVYGLIRFGSRLDTYLPPGASPLVRVGQRAVGGETVLARLPGASDA